MATAETKAKREPQNYYAEVTRWMARDPALRSLTAQAWKAFQIFRAFARWQGDGERGLERGDICDEYGARRLSRGARAALVRISPRHIGTVEAELVKAELLELPDQNGRGIGHALYARIPKPVLDRYGPAGPPSEENAAVDDMIQETTAVPADGPQNKVPMAPSEDLADARPLKTVTEGLENERDVCVGEEDKDHTHAPRETSEPHDEEANGYEEARRAQIRDALQATLPADIVTPKQLELLTIHFHSHDVTPDEAREIADRMLPRLGGNYDVGQLGQMIAKDVLQERPLVPPRPVDPENPMGVEIPDEIYEATTRQERAEILQPIGSRFAYQNELALARGDPFGDAKAAQTEAMWRALRRLREAKATEAEDVHDAVNAAVAADASSWQPAIVGAMDEREAETAARTAEREGAAA